MKIILPILVMLLTPGCSEAFIGKSIMAKQKSAVYVSTAFPTANTITLEQGATIDNPTRAYADDGSYVTQGLGATGPGDGLAGGIKYTGFGFSIPATATILGVTASWKKYSGDPDNTYDASVRLVKAGTTSGDSKSQFVPWPGSATVLTYGGAADLWNNTLTPADVNNAGFGIFLNWVYSNLGVTPVPYYDYVTLSITYRN